MQEKFEYKYTALTEKEKKEATEIRARYVEEDEKMARLKALDEKVKNPPKVWGLALGVIGTLLFGGGLSLILEFSQMVWGCALCTVGLVPVGLAYPVYQKTLNDGKKKYGAEILRLSEEIIQEQKKGEEK